jgi:hypothetical protein
VSDAEQSFVSIFRRVLLSIVVLVVVADCIWASLRHFEIDVRGYLLLAIVSGGLGIAAMFYARVRRDEHLSAMLFGAGFLIAFSAGASVLNYLLATVAGPRIDWQLAAVDKALGFDWPAVIAVAMAHPRMNALLQLVYGSVLPQIAVLVICLGWQSKADQIYRFCLALAIGAAVTIVFWTLLPSAGPYSVFLLRPDVIAHLNVVVNSAHENNVVKMLSVGPGAISPHDIKGLIAFPSFHTVLALLVVWYAWQVSALRWPIVGINAAVLVSVPIQGGHYLVDLMGGLGVAAISVSVVHVVCSRLAKPRTADREQLPGNIGIVPAADGRHGAFAEF